MAIRCRRCVRSELLTPRPFDLTTFPNEEGYDELVLARDMRFQSLCQHHLLPFHGVAHVGYVPDQRVLGLTKMARLVELLARRLQVQERLTQQWPTGSTSASPERSWRGPRGRAPVHVTSGRAREGSRMVTSAAHGLLRDEARSRRESFALAAISR